MERHIDLLQSVVIEIRTLRKQNEFMNARLEMFDSVMLLLHSSPSYKSQGMSPNLTWEIEKFIDSKNASQNVKAN